MIFEKIKQLFEYYLNKKISKEEVAEFQNQFEVLFTFFRNEIENEIGSKNYELLDLIYMAFDSYEPSEQIRACDKFCIDEVKLMEKIREIYKKISISTSMQNSNGENEMKGIQA